MAQGLGICKACSNGHEPPKVPFIASCFSLEQSKLLRVLVVGSHLWGSCSKKSDWDLVIVVDRPKADGSKAINAHKGNIDAWIVAVEDYIAFLREHLIQALLTIWIPDKLVLMKKESFDPIKRFSFSSVAMNAAIEKLYERDTRVAAKHFSKGDPVAGWKIVKHLTRQLGLCTQIVQSGSICDYTHYEGLDYLSVSSSWEEIQEVLAIKKNNALGTSRTT